RGGTTPRVLSASWLGSARLTARLAREPEQLNIEITVHNNSSFWRSRDEGDEGIDRLRGSAAGGGDGLESGAAGLAAVGGVRWRLVARGDAAILRSQGTEGVPTRDGETEMGGGATRQGETARSMAALGILRQWLDASLGPGRFHGRRDLGFGSAGWARMARWALLGCLQCIPPGPGLLDSMAH
ncbi:hypothetical protein E2562_009029, partial [Oryza meyeriana var. granulata]